PELFRAQVRTPPNAADHFPANIPPFGAGKKILHDSRAIRTGWIESEDLIRSCEGRIVAHKQARLPHSIRGIDPRSHDKPVKFDRLPEIEFHPGPIIHIAGEGLGNSILPCRGVFVIREIKKIRCGVVWAEWPR